MKKSLVLALTLTMALVFSVSTASAWFVSLEPYLDPDGDPAAQVALAPGDTFTIGVYFNADAGGNLLGGYQFNIGFDADELTYVSYTHTPSPLLELFGTPYLVGNNVVENFAAGVFTNFPTFTGKTQLATVTFTATDDIVWDGLLDAEFVYSGGSTVTFGVGIGGSYDILYTGHAYQGPDVGAAPVPVPSAALLLLSGIFGLVGIRRRPIE